MTTVEFVCRVFTVLGQNYVREQTSDLIIEIPKTVRTLENGETCCIVCRRNGADNIERFRDCLREQGNIAPSVGDAFQYCERTLGWEIRVSLKPDLGVYVARNPASERKMSDYEFTSLLNTFANYGILVRQRKRFSTEVKGG